MARLHKDSLKLCNGSFADPGFFDAQSAEINRLQNASDSLAPGTLKGFVYAAPIGDGYAMYLVKSEAPLVLQHIDYMDGYRVPAPMIRGLRREDLLVLADFRRQQLATAAKLAAALRKAQKEQA